MVYNRPFVPFCRLEVPKMWANSPVFFNPVLHFSAFGILIPTLKSKASNPGF